MVQINNDHTRKAYLNATRRFAEWCDARGIAHIADVHLPRRRVHQGAAGGIHAAYGKAAPGGVAHAVRLGHVLDVNPAHAVRGPKYVVKKGKTPVLTADEARTLLDSIQVVIKTPRDDGTEDEEPWLVGLRDRARIGVMVYTFARGNAVLGMKVSDYFVQGRRGWVRLHEKNGKEHEVPCHHNLGEYLDEYTETAGVGGDLTARCSGWPPAASPIGPMAAGREPDHSAAGDGRGNRNERRERHFPGDRHHGLPEERRQAGNRPANCRARIASDYEALRPAAG